MHDYAELAAYESALMCYSEVEFEELFQESYKWIYDTGASQHFCGQERADCFMDHQHIVKPFYVTTASGTVTVDKASTTRFPHLMKQVNRQ